MATSIDDISGVGSVTLERLRDKGIDSINDLAQASIEELSSMMSESKAERLIKEAKQNTVIVQTGQEVKEEYESRERISTGMPYMDDVLQGGLEEGFVVAVSGQSGTGKTQVSFQFLVSAVEQTGKPAVYVETERGRYRDSRLESLASEEGVQDKIYRIKAYDLDQQLLAYDKIRNEFDELSLVVIDSFTARFRLSGDFEGRGTLSQRSTAMGRHLQSLENMAEDLQVPVVITAQVYSNPGGYGQSEYVYGGSLFMHTVSFFIHMKNSQGQFVKANIKNHPGIEDREIYIAIKDQSLEAMDDV